MTQATYCNPIIREYLADPFILPASGAYYLYASGEAADGQFIPIWRSTDLVSWEYVRGAVVRGAGDAWNRRNFWAPEVLLQEGRYWLYYTASRESTPGNTGNRVGVAMASRPEGPFEDAGVLVPHAALDGSPFRDADGSLWLYYTSEYGNTSGKPPGRIYVERLLAPDRIEGQPREVMGHHEWQEGPCVLRRDQRYYLFYSLGGWKTGDYRVAWAAGIAAAGPFEEGPNLLLQSTDYVQGPGHNNLFLGPGGIPWLSYHGWDPAFTARYPRIDPLWWKGAAPYTPGPTSTPQRLLR